MPSNKPSALRKSAVLPRKIKPFAESLILCENK
nr:MAG TPA: hypothetical protein [Caudoviricetes sp.]